MAKKAKIPTGSQAIAAHFADARRAAEAAGPVDDPDPNLPRVFDGVTIGPGRWVGAPHDCLPPGCPVKILGKKGEVVYAVSATGELMAMRKWDQPNLDLLFAPYINYMKWAWPAWSKEKKDPLTGQLIPPQVDRVEKMRCVQALIGEAGRRGIFDPEENLRGRGGWEAEEGEFIWHSGDALWTVPVTPKGGTMVPGEMRMARPAEYKGNFYAQDRPIFSPWRSPVAVNDCPAHQVLEDLKTWQWDRPWLDPILYLGWIATAMMGAALKERPIIFVIGGKGRGKSTLHDYTKAIFGNALFTSANTTAAGIYQNIQHDSRPVMIDEFESRARGEREQSIIEIARVAYSGSSLDRGGADHAGIKFTLRCAFAFSAIIPPPMEDQDRSRIAMLTLDPLKGEGAEPVVQDVWGRMMLRRVMDGWYDFQTEILPRWRGWLHRAGFSARAIDTYGTLLAAAELMVGQGGLVTAGLPDNAGDGRLFVEDVVALIRHATRAERIEQEEKWETVIDKILSSTIDNWKHGEKPTVGMVLEELERNEISIEVARARLALAGLGIRKNGEYTVGFGLCVPKSHPALDKVFDNTPYRQGNWYTALKQAPGEIVPRGLEEKAYTVKISKVAKYCLLVDMDAYEKRRGEP